MAFYDYECGACGNHFELNVSMSEHDRLQSDPPACPKCGKKESKQLISMFSCKTPSGY